jgi:ATP-dependent DNA helicase RecG
MDTEELREVIGELQRLNTDMRTVEAKRASFEAPQRLWQTISAFANTPGAGQGLIVLGLDEAQGFAVSGIADYKHVQEGVQTQCRDMVPPLRAAVEPH